MPQLIKICLYRFVQESLNNAYRHAQGKGQRIDAKLDGDRIVVEVADSGPGLDSTRTSTSGGLGLSIMRDRIESLGGTLMITSSVDSGTRLSAQLSLTEG